MGFGSTIIRLKQHKLFSKYLNHRALMQFSRYITTGLLAAAVEYMLLVALTEWVGLWYLTSNSIAYISGFLISFLLNRFWSFKSKDNIVKQLVLYGILFAINFVLTNALMYALTSILGILYLISKIFVMGIVVIWNFIIYKKIIYQQ